MSVQVKGSGTIGGLDEGLVVSGIVTSSTQINVGSNIKLGNAGVVTATSFVGSGANLTSLPSQVTINNALGNRVITSDGGTTLNGEDTLRYDGTNFLIGTNTEAPYSNRNLTVAAGGSGSGTVAIEIRSASNGTGRVIFSDGTSADSSANEGQIIYQQSDHKLLFGVAANYQNMALESTGGTGANLHIIDGNLKFANGHGIDFSAQTPTSATGATTTAEILDHYEEGSWTPVYLNVNTPNYGHRSGTYTRIGRAVHCQFQISVDSGLDTSDGSAVNIGGLPFTGNSAHESVVFSFGKLTSIMSNSTLATVTNFRFGGNYVMLHRGSNYDINYTNCNSSGHLQAAFTYQMA